MYSTPIHQKIIEMDNFFLKGFNEVEQEILKSLLNNDASLFSYEEIISWFTNLKSNTDLIVEKCDIKDIIDWKVTTDSILHKNNRYFEVLALRSKIGNREVKEWTQPIIKQREHGIIGFIIKKINGVYHLLVQAKVETGNFDIYEMAPTVQCITGSYTQPEYSVNYLDFFTTRHNHRVVYDSLQSEEGGRFYQEQNRNVVIIVDDSFPVQTHSRYIWMTFRQAKEFIKFNNYFNIEARSLITCISPI